MSNYGQKLFDNLTHLVQTNEAFYTVDHVLNGLTYRVFTYRLASYEDFLLPSALECRGHMFSLNADGTMLKLVSLPFEKFFNLNENPMTMDLDLSKVEFVHDKRDGSLISTYTHEELLCLKSKTSLTSDQALDSMRLINTDDTLHSLLKTVVDDDWTVSLEYTSPENRIVLPYQECELRVLGARSNLCGEYLSTDELWYWFGAYMTEDHTHKVDDPQTFIASIADMKGIEGFVIGLIGGQRRTVGKRHRRRRGYPGSQ